MRSANDLIGPATEHIRWYPAIGDQPSAGSRADQPGPRRAAPHRRPGARAALRSPVELTTTTRDHATGRACYLAPGASFPGASWDPAVARDGKGEHNHDR